MREGLNEEQVGKINSDSVVILSRISIQELDLPILKVAATEIVSGVSGESEQKLRELFEQAVVSPTHVGSSGRRVTCGYDRELAMAKYLK